MDWPSLDSFKEKQGPRCPKSLASYILASTVPRRRDLLNITNVMPHSRPPSRLQLSTMHVLRCLLGPPISSAAMSIKIYISLPRRTMTLSLGDPLMADAQRIALDWLLGRFWGNSALLDFVRSTSCVRLSLGISPSLWLPRAKMVLRLRRSAAPIPSYIFYHNLLFIHT